MTDPQQPTLSWSTARSPTRPASGIFRELVTSGYDVVAPPNPLRSLASDAAGPRRRGLGHHGGHQRPLSLAALTEKATAAGWRTRPSWFLVSEHDNAIPPDAERFFAERMKATTEEINASHCAFISQPVAVANFIKKALVGTEPGLPVTS